MKTSKKVSIIVAAVSIILGFGIIFGVAVKADWSIDRFNTVDFKEIKYPVESQFDNISVDVFNGYFRIETSKDDKCTVVCKENENIKNLISVENNTLNIKQRDESKWYDHIGFFWDISEVTVYLPESEYNKLIVHTSSSDISVDQKLSFENVEIKSSSGNVDFTAAVSEKATITTSSGDIYVRNTAPEVLDISSNSGEIEIYALDAKTDMTLKSTSGDINVTEANCGIFDARSTSGDIDITGFKADRLKLQTTSGDVDIFNANIKNDVFVTTTSGDVDLDDSDADSLYIKTTSGDVDGFLRSEKIFITDTNSGDVDVPRSDSGGKCEIYTNSGDITFYVKK